MRALGMYGVVVQTEHLSHIISGLLAACGEDGSIAFQGVYFLMHSPPRPPLPELAEPSYPPLTAHRAPWLVLRRPERQDDDEAAQLTRLKAQHSEVAAAIVLAQDFAQLVRERQPDQLDPWLARAAASPLMPLHRFAKGLRDDYGAVIAGVTLPWSTGPVEGHINRLKLLKRQMFGRAGLDLLQRRFLLAA